MKHLLLLFITIPFVSFSQYTNNTITVTGNANYDVLPDEAVISVEFSTYDKANKSNFEESIGLFQKVIKKWSVPSEDVRLMNIDAINYAHDLSKKIQLNSKYEIDLKNLKIIAGLIGDLLTTGAYSVNIAHLKYNQLDSIQLEVTRKAMLNAREKATLMAESQGHALGNTVLIRELGAESKESGDYYKPKYGDYTYDYRSRSNATGAVSRATSSYTEPDMQLNSVYVGVSVKVIYEIQP